MRSGPLYTTLVVFFVLVLGTPAFAAGVVDDPHNWHDGPNPYSVFHNGNLVATTHNYIEYHTVSGTRRAYVSQAYIDWNSGSCVKQQIYARVWDNTAAHTVIQGTKTASTCNKSTFLAPAQWLQTTLPAFHTYHLHYLFSVWTSSTGWVDSVAKDSSAWDCTASVCVF
jgi:hypothetical protein